MIKAYSYIQIIIFKVGGDIEHNLIKVMDEDTISEEIAEFGPAYEKVFGAIDGISYRRGHLWRGNRRRTPISAIMRKWTDFREHSHNPETWGTL